MCMTSWWNPHWDWPSYTSDYIYSYNDAVDMVGQNTFVSTDKETNVRTHALHALIVSQLYIISHGTLASSCLT